MGTTSPLREGKRNSRFPLKEATATVVVFLRGSPLRESFSILSVSPPFVNVRSEFYGELCLSMRRTFVCTRRARAAARALPGTPHSDAGHPIATAIRTPGVSGVRVFRPLRRAPGLCPRPARTRAPWTHYLAAAGHSACARRDGATPSALGFFRPHRASVGGVPGWGTLPMSRGERLYFPRGP